MDWYYNIESGLYFTGRFREWQVEVCSDEDDEFGSLYHWGQFIGFVDTLADAERIIILEIAS